MKLGFCYYTNHLLPVTAARNGYQYKEERAYLRKKEVLVIGKCLQEVDVSMRELVIKQTEKTEHFYTSGCQIA